MPEGTQAKTTTKSPTSTKATHGSKSSASGDTASQHHVAAYQQDTPTDSGKGGGGSWAINEWLKQTPREDPWNAFGGKRESVA